MKSAQFPGLNSPGWYVVFGTILVHLLIASIYLAVSI